MRSERNAFEKIGNGSKIRGFIVIYIKKRDSLICREDPASDPRHSTHCFLTVQLNQRCVLSFIVIRIGGKIWPRIIATIAKTNKCTWRRNTSYTSNEQITTRPSYTTVAARLNCKVSQSTALSSCSLSLFFPSSPSILSSSEIGAPAENCAPISALPSPTAAPSVPFRDALLSGKPVSWREGGRAGENLTLLRDETIYRFALYCGRDQSRQPVYPMWKIRNLRLSIIKQSIIYFSIFMTQILNCLDFYFNIELEFLNVF